MRFARFLVPFGAAIFLLGCGDDVAPTPRGAVNAAFTVPATGGCNIGPHPLKIGAVDSSHATTIVTDGEGATVNCSVTGDGNFHVTASEVNGVDSLYLVINSLTGNETSATPAKGAVTYSSQKTAGNAYVSPDDTPCNFYFKTKPPEAVAAGKVWAAFSCPKIAYGQDTCALSESYFVFENCEGSPTN